MNINDDNSITYIAYKVAILLVLLILIFNADQIAPRIFLYNYEYNNYSELSFMQAYLTTQIILSLFYNTDNTFSFVCFGYRIDSGWLSEIKEIG